ncbi:NUDIX domain-containing protein [Pontibacillus marinus]|uniref:NUDIX domain-containing protein n=1 Tax=Pontibacillus marinus TaxID=273164 RepID=UPI0003FB8C2B|nr:NUDIX hydrolase [Pontibacillus marinus]
MRELKEETGSNEFSIVKVFDEKICFEFPNEIKEKIGYKKKETTIFLVEFLGNSHTLNPKDDEICELKFIEKENVIKVLTHQDTKDYFIKHLA